MQIETKKVQSLIEEKNKYLIYVHVNISRLVGVKAHHSWFDSDGWFAVGRRSRYTSFFIASHVAL